LCVIWLKVGNTENITDRNAVDSLKEVKDVHLLGCVVLCRSVLIHVDRGDVLRLYAVLGKTPGL
jgi:hypothetical protein